MAIASTGRRSRRTKKPKKSDEVSNTKIILLIVFCQCVYQTYKNLRISIDFMPVSNGVDPAIRQEQPAFDSPRMEPPPKTQVPTVLTSAAFTEDDKEISARVKNLKKHLGKKRKSKKAVDEEEEIEEGDEEGEEGDEEGKEGDEEGKEEGKEGDEEGKEEGKEGDEEGEGEEETSEDELEKENRKVAERLKSLKETDEKKKAAPILRGREKAAIQKAIEKNATHEYQKFHDHRFSDPVSEQWVYAMQQAEIMLKTNDEGGKTSANTINYNAKCLVPDIEATEKMARRVENLHEMRKKAMIGNGRQLEVKNDNAYAVPLTSLPIINVGMPKLGSTTLHKYYTCKGFNSTHWTENTEFFEGVCMRDAVRSGLPPLKTCTGGNIQALMQMDVSFPFGSKNRRYGGPGHVSHESKDDCFFPQLSILDEIHQESKYATFVLTFRPMKDWVKSITGWYSLMERLRDCNLPNLPRGVPDLTRYEKNDPAEVESVMTHFFCSHVLHVRNFVKQHPSHNLIELDLYHNNTEVILDTLFPFLPPKAEATTEPEEESGEEGDEYDEPDDGDDDIMGDDDDVGVEVVNYVEPVKSCWKHSNNSNRTVIGRGKKRKKAKKARQ